MATKVRIKYAFSRAVWLPALVLKEANGTETTLEEGREVLQSYKQGEVITFTTKKSARAFIAANQPFAEEVRKD